MRQKQNNILFGFFEKLLSAGLLVILLPLLINFFSSDVQEEYVKNRFKILSGFFTYALVAIAYIYFIRTSRLRNEFKIFVQASFLRPQDLGFVEASRRVSSSDLPGA